MEKVQQKMKSPLVNNDSKHDEPSKITLRKMELSDVDDFMVWATDPLVTQFCRWEPYTSKEQGIDYIITQVIPDPYYRAICLNNRAIGALSVTKNSGEDICRGELGYLVGSKYWGKGIATRAVKILVSTIFEEWPCLERVEALVDVDNVGSQKVLEKAGFTKEGVLRKYVISKGRTRDMVMYGMLSIDPRSTLCDELHLIS